MQATVHSLHTPFHQAALRAARQALDALHDAWRRWRRVRATQQALGALDDHALRDLAIDRSELGSIARLPNDPQRRRTLHSDIEQAV